MRCPDCNKFCSVEEQEPEVEDVEVNNEDGTVSYRVRIANACQECGTELREAYFEGDTDNLCAEIKEHECKLKEGAEQTEGFDLEATEESSERDVRTEGKGRGTKTFYGFVLRIEVKCAKCDACFATEVSDDVQASAMDECC